MNRRKVGLVMIAIAISLWVLDRVTLKISSWLGQMICGETYLQPVEGVVAEASCGSNVDMYFVVGLFGLILLGMWLARFSGISREQRSSY